MTLHVARYESTPNPNAIKVWLDAPISDVPRSFLNREAAAGDALAEALFDEAGATTLLFCGEWFTFNKKPGDSWDVVKRHVESVIEAHAGGDE